MPHIVADDDRALAQLRRHQFDDGSGEFGETIHQQKIDRAAAVFERNVGIALAQFDQIGNSGFHEMLRARRAFSASISVPMTRPPPWSRIAAAR